MPFPANAGHPPLARGVHRPARFLLQQATVVHPSERGGTALAAREAKQQITRFGETPITSLYPRH